MTLCSPGKEWKDLYAVGEFPPIGCLPARMHAFAVRQERHGEPLIALKEEILPTPVPDSGEVVIMVMAAGIGISTVWACLGIPTSPFITGSRSYHIPGSDCTGIVWAVGTGVTGWHVGTEVVVHPVVVDGRVDSNLAQIWGYETPDGALAQFARVQAAQLLPRPLHLSWAESACYLSTLATAYRMLSGHPPHVVGLGQKVLVWNAAREVGAMATQLVRAAGATAVAIVNDPKQAGVAIQLGAAAVIDRSRFDCFNPLPDVEDETAYSHWRWQTAAFISAARATLGEAHGFDIVCEQSGRATLPLSCRLVRRGGMVVFYDGATGYTFTFDARPAWRGEIRLQGSYLASSTDAAAANRLVQRGVIDPCMSAVFDWQEAPIAHTQMLHGRFQPGNMVVLVQNRNGKDETRRRYIDYRLSSRGDSCTRTPDI